MHAHTNKKNEDSKVRGHTKTQTHIQLAACACEHWHGCVCACISSDCVCMCVLSVRVCSTVVTHWQLGSDLHLSLSLFLPLSASFFPVSAAQSSLHCTEWPLFSVHWRHPWRERERVREKETRVTHINSPHSVQFVCECEGILPKFDLSENVCEGKKVPARSSELHCKGAGRWLFIKWLHQHRVLWNAMFAWFWLQRNFDLFCITTRYRRSTFPRSPFWFLQIFPCQHQHRCSSWVEFHYSQTRAYFTVNWIKLGLIV